MNPITNMRNLNKMNDRELEMGLSGTGQSWHNEYKDSAWIFIGGLPYDLSEGDVICVFSQFGEIVHINLVRDLNTGKVYFLSRLYFVPCLVLLGKFVHSVFNFTY